MFDPTGPGTPAWNAFDKAVDAYRATPRGAHYQTTKTYKQYANYRSQMINHLRKHDGDVAQWCELLRERCREND